MDEKSQIQALDRTQPGLPLKRGRGATMTHDYKRNGTATLFAALNAANGEVYGLCQAPCIGQLRAGHLGFPAPFPFNVRDRDHDPYLAAHGLCSAV